MFERFTDRARRAVVMAQEEARRLQHNYIGTEHLLLGLLREGDGIAARALARSGISLDQGRSKVKEIIGLGSTAPSGHIPFTPRAKKVLELSLRESNKLGDTFIGTEHLLLGLIAEGEGIGAQILERETDTALVRDAVLRLRGHEEREPPQILLRGMTPDEWKAWKEQGVEMYAEDDARAHGISLDAARANAHAELARLLPKGSATEGHRFLIAEDEETKERVGYVWFAPRTVEAGEVCWLYDITVDEEMRGRGYGRALMAALETEAAAAGLSRIELNVFGFNRTAINLYRSLGYTEMGRQMFKELGSG